MAENSLVDAIRAALNQIDTPGGGKLADYAGLSDIIVTASAVAFAISVDAGSEGAFAPIREAAQSAAEKVSQGRKVMVSLTSNRTPAGAGVGGAGSGGAGAPQQAPPQKTPVPGVDKIIAVASGKGGVGKSTCTVNLALALQAEGLRVGVLDADLYGPSIPTLLGLKGKPAVRDDGIFAPHIAHGLKAVSIGSMLAKDQAVVWRGPMASSGLRQLLRETNWGELDVLLIDMPPGTGDIQISLCQQVALAGAVIISTPQDLALIDARKAIDMFHRMQIQVLGIVENMSYFLAPDTGTRYNIFGHGGAQTAAGEQNIAFLGEVPLHMAVREHSDMGTPTIVSATNSLEAEAFRAIATKLREKAEI